MSIKNKFIFVSLILSFLISPLYAKITVNTKNDNKQISPDLRYEEIVKYYRMHPNYFEFDLKKYSQSKKKLSVTGIFLTVDLTASALLLVEASPIAMLPLSTASKAIIKTAHDYFSKKKMLKTLRGAYLYIERNGSIPSSRKEKKYLNGFSRFCEKTMAHYQLDKGEIDGSVKRKIALKLLNINHFYRIILYRLQNDPSLYEQFGMESLHDIYIERGLTRLDQDLISKRAILIDQIVVDLFSNYSFNELNDFIYGKNLGPRILYP